MNKTLTIFSPILGGKIRGVLNTIFVVFVLVTQFWPSIGEEGWAGTVIKVYGFLVALVQILTHGTTIGPDTEPE